MLLRLLGKAQSSFKSTVGYITDNNNDLFSKEPTNLHGLRGRKGV